MNDSFIHINMSSLVQACAPLYVPILDNLGNNRVSGTPRGRCIITLDRDLLPANSTGSPLVLQLSSGKHAE